MVSPKLGELNLVAQPIKLTRTPSALASPPPERGQHTDEILAWAGYAVGDIKKLHDKEVV